ncbi:MAG: threonine--tRNA ligase [Candidatus Woesearchaeota archaeon]|nr:threonine--tRNA ligase [Candidatus Woesearchaeota archaeon]MDP7322379.1 threonine--tRNA ligase [Candidatus Woesearchaeota archaeon]MDP7476423.1 threonine--tRNA ligase [Candidatus Woesearchaeota archaeon]
MPKINLVLPDGSSKSYDKNVTGLEVAKSIGPRLAQDALAIDVNGKLVDLSKKIDKDSKIKILTFKDKEGIGVFRHSTAHVLAQAVIDLFPKALPTIGPVVEEGFYYDFDIDHHFTPEDVSKIEKKMWEIVNKDYKFERKELSEKEAKKIFKNNKYKIELIEEFNEPSSAYKQGNFIDLCRGPHILSTRKIEAFKIIKIAGAYWKGDAKNKQLQRIYGISFPEKKQLKDYLQLLEEAEKRDHRKIGKQLDLFSLHEEGPGFIFFHPKGVVIINILKDFLRKELDKLDYKEVMTPMILSRTLWEQSGHWDHYKENMYFTKVEGKDFAVKPMNCPGAILIYKEKLPSYRDLPIRFAEFGVDHRHELSGVLAGLFRVRAFTQDDAHIFCMQNQIQKEVLQLIDLTDFIYKTFNFAYHIELSTRPEKFTGKIENWNKAEKALEDALNKRKVKFKINPGDGAFYGPKIDFHIKDCLGRTWQCATIQVDFSMPDKFSLNYIAEDGNKHRSAMIHRTILGSIERFLGILIEHYAGKFPLWLAPVQVKILTVADRFNLYAKKIKEELERDNLRVELDTRTESVGRKVWEAQLQKIPIIINVGEKEEKNKTVAVRTLNNKLHFNVKVKDLVNKIIYNVEKKEESFKL